MTKPAVGGGRELGCCLSDSPGDRIKKIEVERRYWLTVQGCFAQKERRSAEAMDCLAADMSIDEVSQRASPKLSAQAVCLWVRKTSAEFTERLGLGPETIVVRTPERLDLHRKIAERLLRVERFDKLLRMNEAEEFLATVFL